MGSGIDLAKTDAPEHAKALEDFRDQLLIALLRRIGPEVDIPASEVDETWGYVVAMSVKDRTFHFEVRKKQ